MHYYFCILISLIGLSVIESLDVMKKEKGNYAAREAIKFLEKELEEGNRYLRTQDATEIIDPGKVKPYKQDLNIW